MHERHARKNGHQPALPRTHDFDEVPTPDPLLALLPFPFSNLALPVTDATFIDTVGPLLTHCAGLAETCQLAGAHVEDTGQQEAVAQTLAVLRHFLAAAVAIFEAWTARNAPSLAEDDSAA
jgi:hypothetical protein